MPPTMTTQSVSRPADASRGGGTGGRAGIRGGRTRGRSGDQGDGRIDGQGGQVGGQAQVGDQGRGQGNGRNQNGDAVNDNIHGDVSRGCTYKEFLACNPKKYDGKGGAIVYTHWIEKMESVQDMSGCRDNQKVKYTTGSFVDFKTLTREEFYPSNEMQKLENELWNHAMVGASHAAYTDMFHKLYRLVPNLVTPEGKRIERYVYGLAPQIRGIVAATEPKTIQKAMQIAGTLTVEALRNGSIKKNPEKRGNIGEPSKDRNVRDGNKRTRTGNAFATTTNPIGRENTGTVPKNTLDWKKKKLEDMVARSIGKLPNGKAKNYEDEDDHLIDFKTEFPAIVFDNTLTTIQSKPTACPPNENELDFRISLDESDDEDYTVVYDENSFSYKIISVNNLKTDFENDNDKVNIPSFPSPEPDASYFNDLDFFKEFETEFPAIVYHDALMSILDFLTKPTVSPQHIDEFE
ncbi:reverse transcriptase domain-containing protein [Tanacetum coccineum]